MVYNMCSVTYSPPKCFMQYRNKNQHLNSFVLKYRPYINQIYKYRPEKIIKKVERHRQMSFLFPSWLGNSSSDQQNGCRNKYVAALTFSGVINIPIDVPAHARYM